MVRCRQSSQPTRVAYGVAVDFAGLGLPAGAAFAIASSASGVEAEAAYDEEDVALADVDGDPFALSLFPVIEKSVGGEVTF